MTRPRKHTRTRKFLFSYNSIDHKYILKNQKLLRAIVCVLVLAHLLLLLLLATEYLNCGNVCIFCRFVSTIVCFYSIEFSIDLVIYAQMRKNARERKKRESQR